MKLLLTLGASLTLSVAAQTDGESSPTTTTTTPSTKTQPLPRAKAGVPEKGTPANRLGDSFAKRRAHIAEARKKARASASKKKPEAAKLVLPAESASDATLPGTWVLQSESLGKSLTEQFQEAAGKGATFKLGKLDGHYLAEINPEDSKITVKWNEWKWRA